LTRQPVQGRANDGGLRIGEMERDGVLAHGMSYFLNESFMVRGDEYYIAVCNKTGCIAIYNESKNLFLSPYADGPINFHKNPDDSMNIKNISKFGRSFSILRIPYSFKLLMQELLVMNIQMRIITEDNIDQLNNMCYSSNINKLLNGSDNLEETIKGYLTEIKNKLNETNLAKEDIVPKETPELPSIKEESQEGSELISPEYPPASPAYDPNTLESNEDIKLAETSPVYEPNISVEESEKSQELYYPSSAENSPQEDKIKFDRNSELKQEENKTILEVEEPQNIEENDNNSNNNNNNNDSNSDDGNKSGQNEKKVIINLDKNENIGEKSDSGTGTKKINLDNL
jgi:DNA-directed RNA polymerase II subunit RPB2